MGFDDETDGLALTREAQRLHEAGDFAGVRELLANRGEERLVAEPALGYWLAYALRRLGEPRGALGLARALEEPCRRGADRGLARSRLNLEAMALFDLGRVEEAGRHWASLLAAATDASDHPMVAHAANNLGVVATLAGRSDEALSHYARALMAYERLGDERGIALTHQNLGIAYRERGRADDADEHFRTAARNARPGLDEDIAARAMEERALLTVLRGDGALGEAKALRARELMKEIGDRAGEGECLRVIGLSRIARGDGSGAREPLQSALAIARDVGAALLEAETLEALALLDDGPGSTLGAEAQALFARLGAPGWGRSVRRAMERIAAAAPG